MNRKESSTALCKIKEMLSKILKRFSFIGGVKFDANRCGLLGHVHMMAMEGKEGLTGKDVSLDTASDMLLGLDQSQVDSIDIFVFKKVCQMMSDSEYICTYNFTYTV